MAIPNIQLGRVESDPMGIPVLTGMRRGQGERFEQLLRDSVAGDKGADAPARERVDDRTPDVPDEAPVADAARPQEAAANEEAADQAVAEAPAEGPTDGPAAEGDVTESIRRGEPDRHADRAGKGTDSPRTSNAQREPLIVAAIEVRQQQAQAPTAGANGQVAQTQAVAARGAESALRGVGGGAPATTTTQKAQSAQAGYSTRSAANLQMLEQARDSVFKQILMKLNGDGGEVRMRLQPPDLGELDLKLTVEGGNKLTLMIAAERSDMTQLLQRHLDELKQSLQQSGLEVTDAEIWDRDEYARREQANADAFGGAAASDRDDHDGGAAPDARMRGYITASGLDYWV